MGVAWPLLHRTIPLSRHLLGAYRSHFPLTVWLDRALPPQFSANIPPPSYRTPFAMSMHSRLFAR